VMAVDLFAECGYVFIQEPGKACFQCCFPKTADKPGKIPCQAPASIDVLNVVAGVTLFATNTILQDRQRSWNYRLIHLAGFAPDITEAVERNLNCPLCGKY
jgi:hypothetical protein